MKNENSISDAPAKDLYKFLLTFPKTKKISMCMAKGGILCLWHEDCTKAKLAIKIHDKQMLKKLKNRYKPCPFDIVTTKDAKKQEP